MEEALRDALVADTALTALVGGATRPRIHWDRLPERKSVPALILHQVASDPVAHTYKGRVPTQAWLVQLDAWAGTRAEAIALRDAALAALDGMKTPPVMAFPEGFHSAWESAPGPDRQNASEIFRASIDAKVWHFPTA